MNAYERAGLRLARAERLIMELADVLAYMTTPPELTDEEAPRWIARRDAVLAECKDFWR